MTSQVFIATAALFVAAFAPTPLPNSKKAPTGKQTSSSEPQTRNGKHAKKGKQPSKGKKSKGKKGGAKLQPLPGQPGATPLRFKPLLTKAQIARLAKVAAQTQHKPAPKTQDTPSSVRTLATLSAAHPRDGDFSLTFQCAYVSTDARYTGEHGSAAWSHKVLTFCREHYYGTQGLYVSFLAEADSVYSVDCNWNPSTRFSIRQRVATVDWGPSTYVTTDNPSAFLFVDEGGWASVQMTLAPEDDSAEWQGVETCRVRKIG